MCSHCPWSKTYFPGCSPFAKAVANAWTHTINMSKHTFIIIFYNYYYVQLYILCKSKTCITKIIKVSSCMSLVNACRQLSFRLDKWSRPLVATLTIWKSLFYQCLKYGGITAHLGSDRFYWVVIKEKMGSKIIDDFSVSTVALQCWAACYIE